MLGFWRKRKRQELLSAPFPDAWETILRQNVAHYTRLFEPEKTKLRDDLRIFIAEKDWEGCGGLEMTDEIKVTVAAQACLLTLSFDFDPYPNVTSILVYPTGYLVPEQKLRPGGVVHQYKSHRLGEAWSHGPLVLSWEDALAGGRDEADGHNVVLHEFAHKLDMRSGPPDGVPTLLTEAEYAEWDEVMTTEFWELVRRSDRGQATLLDTYGATDGAEFFAVATECFFERSLAMREEHPRLYQILSQYYRQDPASRLPPAGTDPAV